MKGSAPLKWRKQRREAMRCVGIITRRLGLIKVPIPLQRLAEERKIKDVIFQPLLTDGGIAACKSGSFVMYVNCAKEDAPRFRASFYDRHDGGVSLPPRLRFTIAHEIGHTFFFDLSKTVPVNNFEVHQARELEWLESSCNQIAASILMPTIVLQKSLRDRDIWCAEGIIELARTYSVSVEAFLHQLDGTGVWARHQQGAVILYRRTGPKFRIVAMVAGQSIERLFHRARPGADVSAAAPTMQLLLTAVAESRQVVEVPCLLGGRRAIQRCILQRVQVSSSPLSFLLSMQRDGPPRVLTQNAENKGRTNEF